MSRITCYRVVDWCLWRRQPWSVYDLMRAIECDETTARRHLRDMLTVGLIEKHKTPGTAGVRYRWAVQ